MTPGQAGFLGCGSASYAPWFLPLRPGKRGLVRLVCFPYAGGGSAVFRPWARLMPEEFELFCLQMPGREARLADSPRTDFPALAAEIAQALVKLPAMPTAFFGHSLGSLLAYEVAHLVQGFPASPRKLLLSGCSPPHVRREEVDEEPVWQLSDDAFLEKIRELNGTPDEILQNAEMMDLIMPMLRADFRLADGIDPSPRQVLAPICAFGGKEDSEASEEDIREWKHYSTAIFSYRMFPGDHFFINSHREMVCRTIVDELAGLVF